MISQLFWSFKSLQYVGDNSGSKSVRKPVINAVFTPVILIILTQTNKKFWDVKQNKIVKQKTGKNKSFLLKSGKV